MPSPDRILIVRPSALGDVCRTVPALVSLRAAYPGARIDWLVRDVYAPAIASHPALSSVVPFPRSRFATAWRSPAAAAALVAWLRSLAAAHYDVVYDLQGLFRSAMFALATRAPRRVGRSPSRELAFLGLNVRHRVPRDAHDVDATLALLRADGVTPIPDVRLYADPAQRAALPAPMRDAIASGRSYALLAPTSRWPGKRWPIERFRILTESLLQRRLVDAIAVAGAPGEEAQCEPLLALGAKDPRVIDLVGKTSVGALLSAVQSSALVVANDSAVLHMAVGFDRPLVALFGPTSVARVGPFGRERDVLQRIEPGERLDHKDEQAGQDLMRRISPEDVLAAAERRLAPRPAPPPAPTIGAHAATR